MAQPFFEENPLTLELRTLREAAARFQEEAHASGVKLQRHSLDSANLHERAVHLERENDLLKAELAVLRANPHPDASNNPDARSQIQELTLGLRKLSQQIVSTEDALLSKTTELIHAQEEMIKANAAAEGAYELGARVRGREEAALARERELQHKVVQLEEDARITDVALKEYAALVREMENRRSSGGAKDSGGGEVVHKGTRISATVFESKLTRSKLLSQFKAKTDRLQSEAKQLNSKLEVMTSLLDAECKGTTALVRELGNTKAALEKLQLEDGTAAKMVSRYMQFSQNSTNDLLSKLSALKARHEGTLRTLASQNHALTVQLRSSEAHTNHLLRTLDELGGEIMKEAWGRRREIGLRIRMGGREERVVESIRRWVRKGEELLSRINGSDLANPISPNVQDSSLEALLLMAQDARILLASLDEGSFDEELGMSLSGGKARILLGNISLDGLLNELKDETEKRLKLQKQLAALKVVSVPNGSVSAAEPMAKEGKHKHDLPDIPLDSGNGDLPETRKDDIPPMVPEKTTVLPPIPDIPVMRTTLQSGISRNGHESNISEVPSPETSAPLDLHLSEEPAIDDVSTTPTANRAGIIPFPTSETPSQSASTQPVLSSIVEPEPLLESNRSTSTPLDILDAPLETHVTEAIVETNHARSSLISVEISDTLNLSPTVALTVDNSDSAFVGLMNNTVNEATISSDPDTPSTLGSSDPKIIRSLVAIIHEDIPLSIPPSTSLIDIDGSATDCVSPSSAAEATTSLSIIHDTTTAYVPSAPALLTPPSLSPPPSNPISSSPFASSASTPIPSSSAQPHPLLDELIHVTKRYDDLQRAFRDCHYALETLKAGLRETSASHSSAHILGSAAIPNDILSAALARLDDYTEDARVELEIRVGDEALLSKGYEALLSVPGAMDTASLSAPDADDGHGGKGGHTQFEVEKQISEFVSGTDPAVRRARETFTRKLDDVQHDIAALKRAIHDPESFGPAESSSADSLTPSSSNSALVSPSSRADLSAHAGSGVAQPNGWTSWIRSASLPASPAPPTHGPAPTFGNIMTAPRLRHAPSFGNMSATTPPTTSPARSRRPSFFGLGSSVSEPPPSPLAALELRVPMPSFAGATSNGRAILLGAGAYGGMLSPTSPLKAGSMAQPTRVRTVSSTMYMLGLGAAGGVAGAGAGGRMTRASSASLNPTAPASPLRSALPRSTHPSASSGVGDAASSTNGRPENESTTEEEEEDTDVE